MSRKYESSFVSEADGMNISVMAVLPDEKPYRAMVQIVHGMSEHKSGICRLWNIWQRRDM